MEFIKAFLVGGALCAIAQVIIDKTKITPARVLTGYVLAGAILSAIGLYGPLVAFGGAGAFVPLTGFGHLLAEGTRTAVMEKGIVGVFTGGVCAAAAGITASVVFGFLAALIFKPKQK